MDLFKNGNILDISGQQVRMLIGLQSISLGIIYAFIKIGSYTSHTYIYQSQIFPFWVYSLAFSILGLATILSCRIRLSPIGRRISVTGMSIFLLYSLTFVPFGSFSALAIYPVITYAYLREAFTTS